jgi:predicted RNA-binding protein with PUA-like domain
MLPFSRLFSSWLQEARMARSYWLIKSEPYKYAWSELVADGSTYWDGVRNYEARNNLGSMKVGDLCLYYHSNQGKEVVGVAKVCRESYPDPTTDDERWLVVDVEPVVELEEPVTLADIKAEPALAEMALIRRGRLSVVPVDRVEFQRVLRMGKTSLPRVAAAKKQASVKGGRR